MTSRSTTGGIDELAHCDTQQLSDVEAILSAIAHSPQRQLELGPDDRIGRFSVIRTIGRGGSGIVHEARDLELGRHVALKLVRARGDPHSRSADALEMLFRREADAAARLNHPNIVTLHDFGIFDSNPYRGKETPTDYRYTPGDFCDYLTDGNPDAVNVDALRKAGALLANRSTHLDALLAKWTSTGGKKRTSALLVDSGTLEGAPKVAGYLRPSTPQGTVFKTSPPPEVLGSAAVVELKTYRNSAGDFRTTTASPPADYTEVALEGWIYRCVAGEQRPTKSTPLYTQKISSTDYVTHVLPTAPANTPCAGPDVPLVIEGYLPILSD